MTRIKFASKKQLRQRGITELKNLRDSNLEYAKR
jgi:hypothetical protein